MTDHPRFELVTQKFAEASRYFTMGSLPRSCSPWINGHSKPIRKTEHSRNLEVGVPYVR